MNENQENDSPVKLYHTGERKLEIRSFKCLICGRQEKKDNMRNPQSKGITTFINFLIIRKNCNGYTLQEFGEYIDFETKSWIGDVSQLRWHANCYAAFVNKRDIETSADVYEASASTTRSRADLISDFSRKCFFCGYTKHKGDSKLKLIQYENSLKKLEAKCEEKHDQDFKRKIGGDFSKLPAYDAKYHALCYKNYMKDDKPKAQNVEFIHETCFQLLVQDINPAISSGRALSLVNLLERFKELLKENEYENFDSYTTQKLSKRLKSQYGSKILFAEARNSKMFIYDSGISITDAINSAAKYKQQLKDQELMNDTDTTVDQLIVRVAEVIKNDIKSVSGININPLDPTDISLEKVKSLIPQTLQRFLELVTGSANIRKLSSIAQDLISLQSNGKKRMPKHVGLGVSLKSNVRSKEYITYLHRLGHCISYDDVLRIDTTWATNLVKADEGYAMIPINIFNRRFTQAASDNADYGQENNSQHVTNTVLYQYGQPTIQQKLPMKASLRNQRRSIDIPKIPLQEFRAVAKPMLPGYYSEIDHAIIFSNMISDDHKYSSSLNKAWALLRITGTKLFAIDHIQTIPNWTGFRKIVSVKISIPTTIGNCRSLPASPTDISVVYNMLINLKKIFANIGVEPCVTVDEAIYQLVKQIQWTDATLEDIVVRMGGFHRAKNFCGVIGKRMKGSGFGEIFLKSGMFGSNQIDGKECIYFS